MRTIIFNLLNQGLVKMTPLEYKDRWGRRQFEIVSIPSPTRMLNPIEEEVYQFLELPKNTRELFESVTYLKIKIHLDSVHDELEELHLAEFGTSQVRGWVVTGLMALVVGIVGGTKLYLGIINNRPVLFLTLLLPLSLYVLFIVLRPRERMKIPTRLGRRYLKELRKHFEWLKEPTAVDSRTEGINPALSAALFGIGAVAGGAAFAGLSKALVSTSVIENSFISKLRDFFRIDYTRSWGGGIFGGCGGGGCGGGGCGGGGCGGGCGGCGG
jgi:uncharacterized protein (TIGR04222 family)